jgi:hypothetical protein
MPRPRLVPAGRSPELGSRDHLHQTVASGCRASLEARRRPAMSTRFGLARPTDALAGPASPLSGAARAQIRASVTALVRQLRRRGMPPEGMLVQVKSAAREALPAPMVGLEARAVIEDVVRWSIAAYYDGA